MTFLLDYRKGDDRMEYQAALLGSAWTGNIRPVRTLQNFDVTLSLLKMDRRSTARRSIKIAWPRCVQWLVTELVTSNPLFSFRLQERIRRAELGIRCLSVPSSF